MASALRTAETGSVKDRVFLSSLPTTAIPARRRKIQRQSSSGDLTHSSSCTPSSCAPKRPSSPVPSTAPEKLTPSSQLLRQQDRAAHPPTAKQSRLLQRLEMRCCVWKMPGNPFPSRWITTVQLRWTPQKVLPLQTIRNHHQPVFHTTPNRPHPGSSRRDRTPEVLLSSVERDQTLPQVLTWKR